MSKPNINIPAEFAVNGIKTPFSNAKVQNGFDRINPDVLAGDNLNKFIDDTYKGLNGVLELYEGCVLYDSTVTYNNTSIVFYINGDDEVEVYRSLINNNLNNPLTDTTAWEKVEMVDISNKADVDLTNVNDAGNIKMAHNAMPSDKYITLTLGASGTRYTAPADGYFMIKGTFRYLEISNKLCYVAESNVSTIYKGGFVPCPKGESVTINYDITPTSYQLRFVYAVGSESEAS